MPLVAFLNEVILLKQVTMNRNGMTKLKFQIIIPTLGGREKYLYWAIRTCLNQDYPDFEILVSNNGGSPDVHKVVSAFDEPRIKYIETSSLLPMAEHWDFAVTHADGDVITIIGDDDALMPNSLAKVNDIFSHHHDVDCVTHLPGQYYWPDYHDLSYRNRYQFRPGTGELEIIDTKPILKKVSEFREWYGKLPFLYHGFVKRRVLTQIIESQGLVFKRTSPDIYSDIALAIVMDRYARFDGCLTFGGQGAKSNGANFFLNNELGKQFTSDLPAYLEPKYYAGNIQIQIYEIIEKARYEFACKDKLDVAWINFAKQSIVEALLTPAHCQNALQALRGIVKNDFPAFERVLTLTLIAVFKVSWINKIAQKVLQIRQRKTMGLWRDADVTCNADNIFDLVECISAKKEKARQLNED